MSQRVIGASPGSLQFLGKKRVEDVTMRMTVYDCDSLSVTNDFDLASMGQLDHQKNYWLEVSGIHDASIIASICDRFAIHALVLESILDTSSQPLFEDLGDSLFTEVKVSFAGEAGEDPDIQQLSIVLTQGVMITFVEQSLDIFAPIQKRLRVKKSRIRTKGLDYLKWAVLDLVTDHALHHIDQIEQKLETLESCISNDRELPELTEVHDTRREVAAVHKAIRPFREISNTLRQGESSLLTSESRAYFNDLSFHKINRLQ
mgnify:CR=1 FL=1